MTLFQQATLLPLLHQFTAMLRYFSMFLSAGTMACTYTPPASSHFIICFQHIKEGKRATPRNQTVYKRAIDHLKKRLMKFSTAVKVVYLNNKGPHHNVTMPSRPYHTSLWKQYFRLPSASVIIRMQIYLKKEICARP